MRTMSEKGQIPFRTFEDSAFQTNREYLRYELMTAYLLSIKRVGIRDLFAGNYEANRVTAQKYLDSLR